MAQREVGRATSNEAETEALLVSDAPAGDSLTGNLEGSPFTVRHQPLGPEAITAAVQARPSVVLIDGRQEMQKALQVCSALRSRAEIGPAFIIIILRDDREQTRVDSFEAGADECFAEPASRRELWFRLEAIKRRMRNDVSGEVIRYADVELDLRRHRVRRSGQLIDLSTAQMRLLRYLMEHPGVVFTRQELLEAVWRDSTLDEGAVTVGVVRLRRALKSTGGADLIRQVRGIGYSLDADLDN
ncbi:MAG TPA: winged helix-turn-helix domain-containing protein [Sphingomicrobium sp.]|nr:winged helix-turn-helix domain-containing protein [Sphingomicrobium sp.]